MQQRFNYKLDLRSKRITWAVIILMMLLTAFFVYLHLHGGAYFPAWFFSILVSVLALYVLSIPRSVRITDDAIEIHCIVELTTIQIEDLHAVRRLDSNKTYLWLLLGSYGFFGYYGYYLDWRRWRTVKVYASQWNNLIEIKDVYDQKFVINCSDPATFIRKVTEAKRNFDSSHTH